MGAEVTVVEVLPRILPVEDEEVAAHARKQFEKQGIRIMSGAKVTGLKKTANSVTATIEDDKGKTSQMTVDRVISAVGVVGNIEGLGLEATKIKTDRGCIVVDGYSRTGEPGIYAIGDVAGPPMLAHKAEHEGVICVEKIAGIQNVHPLDKSKIAGCTYCHPQVASVGLTEAKAKEAGHEVRVGRFPFLANGKAIALGEPEGLVKTIFDAKTGQLLGAHMVGAEVTELIQGFVVAMGLETTEEELMHTVFPHPTLSEMMHESVLDAYGRAIHF
jgi:dihydrolipoamide dehydrogenase